MHTLWTYFPGDSVVKSLPANAGDIGSIPRLGRSLEMATHSVFLPGGFHGQRSLVGYSPQDHRVGHDFVAEQQQRQQNPHPMLPEQGFSSGANFYSLSAPGDIW